MDIEEPQHISAILHRGSNALRNTGMRQITLSASSYETTKVGFLSGARRHQQLDERNETTQKEHRNRVHQIRREIPKWAKQFGIEEDLWHLWKTSAPFTSQEFDEEKQQAVRILVGEPDDKTAESRFLVSYDSAVVSRLADLKLYGLRLYVHLAPNDTKLREKISDQIKKDLPEFPFSD